MQIDVSTLLTTISVVTAVAFGYITMHRNNTTDTEARAAMYSKAIAKLDSIAEDIKDMRKDAQDLRQEVNHLNERVIVLEQLTQPHGYSYAQKSE